MTNIKFFRRGQSRYIGIFDSSFRLVIFSTIFSRLSIHLNLETHTTNFKRKINIELLKRNFDGAPNAVCCVCRTITRSQMYWSHTTEIGKLRSHTKGNGHEGGTFTRWVHFSLHPRLPRPSRHLPVHVVTVIDTQHRYI